MKRREFLGGVAALGAGAWFTDRIGAAQSPQPNPRRIDVHHHFLSPKWAAALVAQGLMNEQRAGWTPATSLEAMDQSGTQTAMISITRNHDPSNDPAEMRAMLREGNEYGAGMVAKYPGRFGLLAALPLPEIDGSLREIEYCFDVLHADGVGIPTSYGDRWLGHPSFAPVFDELNRRRAVVYTHPTTPSCCTNVMATSNVDDSNVEYGADTTRAIMSLLVDNAAARYADVRFIFSHSGGTMPILIERIIGGRGNLAQILAAPAEPGSRLHHLRRFYYDTAATSNAAALGALRKVVPASQILFGTDFPYSRIADVAKGIRESGVFSADELRMIDRENAARLFVQRRT
jgi:predicted TIM-barrel fold metal-dependent hydrolase